MKKVFKQALANAKNNFKIDGNLKVKRLEIGEGPAFKRMDKSHSYRFGRGIIKKRTAHIFLTLETKEKSKQLTVNSEQSKKEQIKPISPIGPIEPKVEKKPVKKTVKKLSVAKSAAGGTSKK